jgi:hypothetical protein
VRRFVLPGVVLAMSGAVVAVAVSFPGERTRALAAYLLALGVLGVAASLRAVRRPSGRSPFEAALPVRPDRPGRLRSLERMEHDCIQGLANPVDLHRRLRPILREVAAQRVAAGHGIELDQRPDAARAILGEETWELVRPDRPHPDEVAGTRLDAAGLRRVLDILEAT